MRILFLAPQPFFVERGTPIAVRYAVEALCRAGHEVDLLVLHEGADLDVPGLTIHRAGRPPFVTAVPIGMSASKLACDAFLVAAATRLLMQRRYDVVHAVEEAVFPALLLKLPGRFKLVYDMDSLLGEQIVEKWPRLSFLRTLLGAVERWPMRGADLVLPVCPAIAERVAREAPSQTIHVLPDAAPARATGDPAEPVMDLRALVGGEGPIALYVGNLEHYQGVDLLLAAMADLPADHHLSLVIVGGTRDHLAEARAAIGRLRLEDRVYLAGPAPLAHLAHLLAQADILCSPRIAGVNTPMKLYAYMQAERAIIATAILSHTQVLSPANACLVAPEREAMAAGLMQLAADASLRARLGEAAGKAAEDYSPAAYEARLRAAYAALGEAESRRARAPLAAMRRGQ